MLVMSTLMVLPIWTHTIYSPGEQVLIPSLDVELSMEEIYQDINFDEPLPEELE